MEIGVHHLPVQSVLFEPCRGAPPVFTTDEITVFKNAGGAHLDLFTAKLLATRMSVQ